MKLHIGGTKVKAGWQILNIQKSPGVDFVGDICDLSQFASDSIEAVYASHVLEHVRVADAIDALTGICRVLKKGGEFYVSVPDLDSLCHAFISPYTSPGEKFDVMRMIFGGQIDDFDYHYFGWNQRFLEDALGKAGFTSAKRVLTFDLFEDYSNFKPFGYPISLNMIATK